ncbi:MULTISPECIES: hypothetical protein [Gilliamella]|uniref:Uncharacterized protein n=1 Tax=Gilliamella apis TaxID=1970738 RepID=A0A2V4DMI3_9GAMM|nr:MULTISPECIES: hypothetical protein [Gilliamella]MBI0005027.1 hypothetical protein [Gilliamella sp. W8126]MBI0037864.1 hypothetical protein [Gilliamella sp. B14384G10]MBI0039859.1 hypothetical protein [Gilliamella sp. B14384G7]MBI0051699.1 hypothetical protein [Gilliamella sp. B14384G13]MBI0054151.1 hypothetical protein [Gilliamella sp. B14384H2]
MTNINLSDDLIKDFIYSMYRKEVLLNLKGVVLTDEDRKQLHEKRDFVNRLSETELADIRCWVLDKLKVLESQHKQD